MSSQHLISGTRHVFGRQWCPTLFRNPEYEAKAHAAIESFWSRNVIYVPSPDINRVGDAVMQKPKKMRVLKGQRHCTDTPAHSKTTGRKGRTVARKKGG